MEKKVIDATKEVENTEASAQDAFKEAEVKKEEAKGAEGGVIGIDDLKI